MPIQRTDSHFTVHPVGQPLPETIPAMMVLKVLESYGVPGMLYTLEEVCNLLEEHHTSALLEQYGYKPLSKSSSGFLAEYLKCLWSNGYIRKFATGRFSAGAGGRELGVVWEIARQRPRI